MNRVARGVDVRTDEAEQDADERHRHTLQHGPMRKRDGQHEAECREREIFGRAERDANRLKGGDKTRGPSVAMQPAMNEPMAEMARAAPARPCRAI